MIVKKKIGQRIHAKKRFMERYGLSVTTKDLGVMVSQIQNGQAEFIRRASTRVTIWDILFESKKMRVVYDRNTHNIVTVFPLNVHNAQKEEVKDERTGQ